jgi:hypothetical protein
MMLIESTPMIHRLRLLPDNPHAGSPARPYIVAITGHRNLGSAEACRFVRIASGELLEQQRRAHPAGVVALSGLAEGADSIFAEEALRLGLPLEGVIACQGLIEDFAPGPARERYLSLCARSRALYQLPFRARSVQAYIALGQRLVEACDLLIAAWNGLPPVDAGGTGGVVAYARACGRPVIHIHTTSYMISTMQDRVSLLPRAAENSAETGA